MTRDTENSYKKTVESFGQEWKTYNFKNNIETLDKTFNEYFHDFPWDQISDQSECTDMGCGSGRWSYFIAPKVKKINCVDASGEAIKVAERNLNKFKNISFFNSTINEVQIPDNSQDFIYSIGVLHHLPDTLSAIKSISRKLKKGKPLFLYIYYNFDNKSKLYYFIWSITNILRIVISRLPYAVKLIVSKIIAIIVYWPLSRLSSLLNFLGFNFLSIPLSYYSNKSLYVMMNDSLDRFGTRDEKRYSKKQIIEMLECAGLSNFKFNEKKPFWCVLSFKK